MNPCIDMHASKESRVKGCRAQENKVSVTPSTALWNSFFEESLRRALSEQLCAALCLCEPCAGPVRTEHWSYRALGGPVRTEHWAYSPVRTEHWAYRALGGPVRTEHWAYRALGGPVRTEHWA